MRKQEKNNDWTKGCDISTYFRSLEGFKRNPQDRIMEITVDHTKSAVITAQLAQEQCKVLIDTGAARCCIREDYYKKTFKCSFSIAEKCIYKPWEELCVPLR